MSKDKLLIFYKTFIELLNKNFIRVSNSSAVALMLFVKKPEKDLRFYIDYKELNRITKKKPVSVIIDL